MVIVIDNYDSFVYNLARYVTLCGYETKVYRNNQVTLAELQSQKPSHIILSPGPCGPSETGVSLEVIRHFAGAVPIFGVCLGHQTIAAAFGARVGRARVPMHGMSSTISHRGGGIFKGLPLALEVGRYHSLIVESQALPECLCVTAGSQEGEIMAIAHRDYPIYGVQFHPESVLTPQGHQIVANFLRVSTCLLDRGCH